MEMARSETSVKREASAPAQGDAQREPAPAEKAKQSPTSDFPAYRAARPRLAPRHTRDQLQIVSMARYAPKRLLNRAEGRLLPVLEQHFSRLGEGHRVMAQVAMGEIMTEISEDREMQRLGHACINSKRLDFVVIDRYGLPKLAIEYNGSGHHIDDKAFMRDAVKREALRRAGIPFLAVEEGTTPTTLRRLIDEKFSKSQPDTRKKAETASAPRG